MAVDQALLAIRRRLEDEYPDEEVHFYLPPIKELWQSKPTPSKPVKSGTTVSEQPAKPYEDRPTAPYTPDDAHQDIFIPPDDFNRLITSIKSRKNLILQGPPGTGKTFIARRIAWCLIGRKDNGPIEMVQFHQSYAYEDFVQGYRPTNDGGFEASRTASSTASANAHGPTPTRPTSSSSTRSTAATSHGSSASSSC